ncbi:reverse transcriptase domain-containing protein [Tanacetum coccineum]
MVKWIGTVFREPSYPFDYPIRRLTMEEILAKFIDEGRRKHEEMEIFIKEFRTTNELLLKTRSNLLSELEIENSHIEVLTEREIADKFFDEHLMVLKSKFKDDEPWYADFVNYIIGKVVSPNWTFEKRKRFFSQVKTYFWEKPYAFKLCTDNIMRRYVARSETLEILAHCHLGPTGGNHSANITAKKVCESRFYWPSIFKDANKYVCEVFDVRRLDFMGPFPQSRGNKYILVAVDYVSKLFEAQALPTNAARVVVKFLRSLFARFGVPKALISDKGTHFCNFQLEKALQRYGVTHKLSTSYHRQSNGQTEVTNRAIKRILERSVGYNPKYWSEKFNDALWAFRTAFKTPTGCTPFRLVYGKACHLPVEIEHKAHWALKQCNMDLTLASESRLMQLNELANIRDGAYETTRIYKERTKKWHDSTLCGDKDFKVGDKNYKSGDLEVLESENFKAAIQHRILASINHMGEIQANIRGFLILILFNSLFNVLEASQPPSSHVVHAGPNLEHMDLEASDTSIQPNPEQMDEEFTTTAYPNVQENLKLPTEDQFLVEKSQEDEPEKTNTESEVQSMVTVPIHQDNSYVPLMTTPVIDLTVSKAVDEIVTDAVDWAIQAPFGDRFRDLPEVDMKEILHHRMWESNSYLAHEDHKMLYKALEKSMARDHTDQLLTDLAEARRNKKKRRDSPKTPPGSPPYQPPPPPTPAGLSGTPGASEASGSSQLPPPLPPLSTYQSDQSTSTAAPSSSKTAASAEYTDWTTTAQDSSRLSYQFLKSYIWMMIRLPTNRISSISIGSSNVQPSESPYLPVPFIGTSQSRQHDKSESSPLRDLEWLGRVVQRITGSMILVFNVSNQPCDSDSICSDPVSA